MRYLIIFLLNICTVFGQKVTFDGYKVFRIDPKTKEERFLITKMQNNNIDDFWMPANRAGLPVDVMIEPNSQNDILEQLKCIGLHAKILIDDVEKLIQEEKIGNFTETKNLDWTSYYRLDDIYAWMNSLGEFFPDNVTVLNIGKSYEGRDIKGLKISFGSGKKAVFLEGGIHAREWISPATVTYIASELLNSENSQFKKIAESLDWYIFPVVNPDGYDFTFKHYRLFRKSRKCLTNNRDICLGVDLNRNWDYQWGGPGSGDKPFTNTYRGQQPFSENETKDLSNFITSIAPNLRVYLAFHSYSQQLLLPFGNTFDYLENYEDAYAIGKKAVEALSKKHGVVYDIGTLAESKYLASGTSTDWVKRTFKIPLVYTYELRGAEKYGFLLPSDQILPNCEEVLESLIALFDEASKYGYIRLSGDDEIREKPYFSSIYNCLKKKL